MFFTLLAAPEFARRPDIRNRPTLHWWLVVLIAAGLLAGTARDASAADLNDFIRFDYDLLNDAAPTGAGDVPGLLYVPENYDPSRTYPLVVVYHGTGEDLQAKPLNAQVTGSHINNLLAEAKLRGFFIYAPQAPSSWSIGTITPTVQMVSKVLAVYNIDRRRLYVTGLSMGGGGTWTAFSNYADIFAAAVPVCPAGGSAPVKLAELVDRPIWVFHAVNDPGGNSGVSVSTVRRRVNEIRRAAGLTDLAFPLNDDPNEPHYNQGEPYFTDGSTHYDHRGLQYTEFPTGGHAIWDDVYDGEAPGSNQPYPLYDWLLARTQTVRTLEPGETLLFDFGSVSASEQDSQGRFWNTTVGRAERTLGLHVASFAFTSAGRRTFVGLEVTDAFGGYSTDGVTAGSIYDTQIAQDAWGTANATDVGQITVRGLAPGASYQLKFFASRGDDDARRGRVTRYTAGGQAVDLDVAINTSRQAVIDGVVADADGRVVIDVRAAGSSRWGYLGALEITRQAAAGAAPFFSQSFNGSTSLAAYVADLPTSGQFNHLGTDGATEAWSIAGGRLRLTAAGTPAGFRRHAQVDIAPRVAAVRFKVGVSGIDTNNDVGTWDLGQIGDVTGYGGSTPNPQVADRLVLKGGGTNAYRFRLNGVSSPIYPANGALLSVVWVVNRSPVTFTYSAPSGAPETVAAERADLWVEGVKLFDDAAHSTSFGSSTLNGFRFRATGVFTMDLDDVVVEDLQP